MPSLKLTVRGLLIAALLAGCEESSPVEPERPASPKILASQFDPATCGSISGQIWWSGSPPQYPQIDGIVLQPGGKAISKQFPNPNTMRLHGSSQCVEHAIVFLEGVDPARSRPWDHAPVQIEIRQDRIRVIQGDGEARGVGVVQAGDEVEMVARNDSANVLSARGAAFFGLAFPDPDRELRRRFDSPGLVELSSGAAKYWHRAYLWVTEHPYFAVTDEQGRFALPQVPAGEYQLIAWHPSGDIAAIDRDPNTGMVLRYHFAEPFRTSQRIRVAAGHDTSANCLLSR